MRPVQPETRLARATALILLALSFACAAREPEPVLLGSPLRSRPTVDVPDPLQAGPRVLGRPNEAVTDDADPGPLTLRRVLASLEEHYPLVLAARMDLEIARGELLARRGAFDTTLGAKATLQPEGFYENERFDVSLEQPVRLFGATFEGGYRLGTGDFAVYDGKAKTNDDGELRLGVTVPLLQGRVIDARRVAELRARLALDQVDPAIQEEVLDARLAAATAYWNWVAAGRVRDIARALLSLAEERQAQVRLAAEEGLLAPIAVEDNERTIVERRSNLIRAERGVERAGIALSLFYRDREGRPVVPGAARLPGDFPEPVDPSALMMTDDLAVALGQRPELRVLELELEQLELERDLAENARLARFDVGVFASQDLGDAANDPDDKDELELVAGVRFEVPFQRRSAIGRERVFEGRLAKTRTRLEFEREVVAAELQDARSALTRSWERLAEARRNVELALTLADAERLQLREGESDLFRVNVREQQTAIAEAALVDVLAGHFRALATYRAVLGQP